MYTLQNSPQKFSSLIFESLRLYASAFVSLLWPALLIILLFTPQLPGFANYPSIKWLDNLTRPYIPVTGTVAFIFITLLLLLYGLALSFTFVTILKKINLTAQHSSSVDSESTSTIKKTWLILVCAIINMILVGLGSVLLVIPGLYLSVVLSLVFYILMFEKHGMFASYRRAFELVRGNWWKVFGLNCMLFIFAPMLIGIILAVVYAIFDYSFFSGLAQVSSQIIISGLVMPWGCCLIYLVYRNLTLINSLKESSDFAPDKK